MKRSVARACEGRDPETVSAPHACDAHSPNFPHGRRAFAAFKLQTLDGEGFVWPWADAPVVAAWVRHASAKALREGGLDAGRIAGEVLGHAGDSGGPRLSYVPLPTVGHRYSDGAIRRVLLAESFDMDGSLAGLLQVKLASRVLTEAGTARPRARMAALEVDDRVLRNYTTAAEVWSTVTPVVLHGYNTSHGKLSHAKTERLLLQALGESGYPETLIREIAFQPACSWKGPGAAASINVPRHLAKWPRYHVSVRFADLVQGPVLAGIGRHYGIGLFAAGRGGHS